MPKPGAPSMLGFHDADPREEMSMSVAKVIEVSASSPEGFEAAIKEAITKSRETVRGIRSAWVKEQQVRVDGDGNITDYQVNVMITFVVD